MSSSSLPLCAFLLSLGWDGRVGCARGGRRVSFRVAEGQSLLDISGRCTTFGWSALLLWSVGSDCPPSRAGGVRAEGISSQLSIAAASE